MTYATFDNQPIASVLAAPHGSSSFRMERSLWGFGGVHGGLTLALLTEAMRRRADGRVLRGVSAQFRRAVRDEVTIEVSEEGVGRSVSWLRAEAITKGVVAVSASATFSSPGDATMAALAPSMPSAPPPAECPLFTVPPGFVPFLERTETRTVGPWTPFSAGTEPELVAWLRLVDDDVPPDEARLMILMDALPPSYGAVLSGPVPIPTVALTVSPAAGLSQATSPWLLLRARTHAAGADGWHAERIDAWTPEGNFVGSCQQLRLVASV